MKKLIEIAVFNINAALAAEKAGADRLELCENPLEGGTTPSFGFLKKAAQEISIPINPIIRPRGGDFLYSKAEFEVMKYDIQLVRDLGFHGAVIGLLRSNGEIDVERTAELVALAPELAITFHRAFDRCTNPLQSLESVIETGCKRILTSGQKPNVNNAIPLIQSLIKKANNRILILPGSGVRSNGLKKLAESTKAVEFHSSARKMIASKMNYWVPEMQEQLEETSIDTEEIKKMRTILSEIN